MCVQEFITFEYEDGAVRQPYSLLCANSVGSNPCANLRIVDGGIRQHKGPKPPRAEFAQRAPVDGPHSARKPLLMERNESAESFTRAAPRQNHLKLSARPDNVRDRPLPGGHRETLPRHRTRHASRQQVPPSAVSSDSERRSSPNKRSLALRRGSPTPPSTKDSSVDTDVGPPLQHEALPARLSRFDSLESSEVTAPIFVDGLYLGTPRRRRKGKERKSVIAENPNESTPLNRPLSEIVSGLRTAHSPGLTDNVQSGRNLADSKVYNNAATSCQSAEKALADMEGTRELKEHIEWLKRESLAQDLSLSHRDGNDKELKQGQPQSSLFGTPTGDEKQHLNVMDAPSAPNPEKSILIHARIRQETTASLPRAIDLPKDEHRSQRASPAQVPPFSAVTRMANRARNLWLYATKQHTLPGYTRVEWTCACGLQIHDDYVELTAGSLENLRSELDSLSTACARPTCSKLDTAMESSLDCLGRSSAITTLPNSSQTWQQTQRGRGSAPTETTQSSVTPLSPSAQRESSPDFDCERGHDFPAQPNVSAKGRGHTASSKLSHLILGCPFSTLATRIEQPEMSNIASDREFFKTLKSQYLRLRGTVSRRLFSLKSLVDMRFVQLELLDTSLAQIRKEDDIPPPELCANMCASQNSSDLYTYNPAPADFVPPIGKRTLMHLLEHPQVANGCASVLFERVPRKLNQKLQVCPQKGYSVGWGLQYVEGLSKERIFVAGSVCCVISTVTGIVYSAVQSDVQGGFGIAAYMMMVLVFLLGSAQVVLDR